MKNKRISLYWKGGAGKLLFLALGGLISGFCNGLLGAGGGIIIVLFLQKLLPKDNESVRSVYSNALLVMLPISSLTLFRYISAGVLGPEKLGTRSFFILLGAMAGGILGGVVLGRLGGGKIKKLFALLTLISGLIMITR